MVFVSDEYSESDNCRMEFQFALKSLKKKVVPVIVGTGNNWGNTIIGMLVSGCEVTPIDMRNIGESDYEEKLKEIMKYCNVEHNTTDLSKWKHRAHSKKRTTCSYLMETALNNVLLPTLFKVFNNIVQHCYA